MDNKDKNKEQDGESTSAESITSPWDACHTNSDLSWEREARDTALAKTITEAVAGEMAKAHVHYQALLNERRTAVILTIHVHLKFHKSSSVYSLPVLKIFVQC